MRSSVINKIIQATGAEEVGKEFVYNDIKRIRFDSDTDYSSIVEAAAEVNSDIGDRLVVWGCGMSDDGHPQIAIQRFESVDPDDVDSIDTFDSTPSSSGRAASKQTFSTQTDGN